jgi:hypothetical protein
MMSQLQTSVLRVLECHGPQDFGTLIKRLRHNQLGPHFFAENFLESKLRQTLSDLSTRESPLVVQGEGYLWKVTQSIQVQRFQLQGGLPNQPFFSLGEGDECVYGLFYPSDLDAWLKSGENRMPIKIGRTRRSIAIRRLELQTGSYTTLEVGFLIHANASLKLEKLLHDQLLHYRRNHARRSEWFQSTFDEIFSLGSRLMQQMDMVS